MRRPHVNVATVLVEPGVLPPDVVALVNQSPIRTEDVVVPIRP